MRLVRLTVENFRCYQQSYSVDFNDLTALVGKNDAGKSTLMDALNIFFEEGKLDQDDGCRAGDATNLRITCSFDNLPTKIVIDERNSTTLQQEYLLDDDGRLTILKTYDASLATPKMRSIEAICSHPTAEGYSDLLLLKRTDLLKRAQELGVDLADVNKQANAPIRQAIWNFCQDLGKRTTAVSLEKDGGKEVWGKISESLPAFALFKSDRASTDQDVEAQDPLKSAIREAIKGVQDKLLDVQMHVEAEVRKITEATVAKIKQMDPSLAQTLDPVIATKKWETLFQANLTGDHGIPINKRGSGVKRLVLLNFFRAKAEQAIKQKSAPSVIYAIEEPETSQHPDNQRLLLSSLSDIASIPGQQVIMTTHTPMLARGLPDADIRFIEMQPDGSRSIAVGGGATNSRIAKTLGVLADHTVKIFVGLEGKHDISFMLGMSKILVGAGRHALDLNAMERDGELIFFPLGGANLALWSSRLSAFNRPEYHLYDRDVPPPADPKYHAEAAAVNARDGCLAVSTCRREMENYLHPQAIVEAYQVEGQRIQLPAAFAEFSDVPEITAEAVHVASGSNVAWIDLEDKQKKNKISRAKAMLNQRAVHLMTAERLDAVDPNGDVISWLNDIQGLM